MAFKDDDLIRIPKRVKLDFVKGGFNPAEVVQEYEVTTFGSYRADRERKASLAWHETHKQADVIVVNQDGDPLYALYKSPLGHHDEMTSHLFKEIRRQRLFDHEWEA